METTRNGNDLDRRVVQVKIRWSVFAGDGGSSGGDIMFGGGCGCVFRERHGFVWWVEILGGKSLVRGGRIFVVSS